MSSPNEQLFLDRFIAFNKDRYSNEPDFVAKLDALTLGNVLFSNFRKSEENGHVSYLVDMFSAGSFAADDQKYQPADYVVNGVATLVSPDPIELADLQLRTRTGIYQMEQGDAFTGSALVAKGDLNVAKIIALIKSQAKFDLTDDQITVSGDLTTATIDSHTVVGEVRIVESQAAEGEHLYNGEYLYDGTLTY